MTTHKTMTDDIKLIWHFIRDLQIEELASIWKNVLPEVPIAYDKTIIVKMVCKILEKKYDISDKKIRQEIESCVNALAAENKEKKQRKQDQDT